MEDFDCEASLVCLRGPGNSEEPFKWIFENQGPSKRQTAPPLLRILANFDRKIEPEVCFLIKVLNSTQKSIFIVKAPSKIDKKPKNLQKKTSFYHLKNSIPHRKSSKYEKKSEKKIKMKNLWFTITLIYIWLYFGDVKKFIWKKNWIIVQV